MDATKIPFATMNQNENPAQPQSVIYNLAVMLGILAIATLVSIFLRAIGLTESNFILSYILGVLLTAARTDGYAYGISASVLGVLLFNFFFTEPYYSLMTYRPDYPVTFAVMLIVAVITSTLTTRIKQQVRLSVLREQKTRIQYQISKSLLEARNIHQIVEIAMKDIAMLFNRSVVMTVQSDSDVLGESHIFAYQQDERTDIFKTYEEMQTIKEVFRSGRPAGAGTVAGSTSSAYYLPVKGKGGIIGVVGVSCFGRKGLTEDQMRLFEAVTSQIALAMEREILAENQRKSKMEAEREKLRGNLLRAMSHDLRTPLTGILGSTATILEHEQILDAQTKSDLLQSIYEDAGWLIHSVENILSITRMEEGKMEIKKDMEAVEEVVAQAASRIRKLGSRHEINVKIPHELIMLPMDGTLIEQVLVNLLDNAVKYTPEGSKIEVKVAREPEQVIFEVSDNGRGIDREDLPHIFERFYTKAASGAAGRRGTGLGLAICKSIVTAHGGEISAFNRPEGGALFRFTLPAKE